MRPSIHPQSPLRTARTTQVVSAFSIWLREDGASLVEAADLLGGPKWAIRAQDVVDSVASGECPVLHLAELRALRRLLHLECVDDLDSFEARRFASLNPDDPRADAARFCAEALDRGVEALVALGRSTGSSIEEAA